MNEIKYIDIETLIERATDPEMIDHLLTIAEQWYEENSKVDIDYANDQLMYICEAAAKNENTPLKTLKRIAEYGGCVNFEYAVALAAIHRNGTDELKQNIVDNVINDIYSGINIDTAFILRLIMRENSSSNVLRKISAIKVSTDEYNDIIMRAKEALATA
jgi:mannitol/fructose-specific phosphotransferase system IIA component